MGQLPDYSFAIISALSWACSAQFVNVGLRRIPRETRPWAVLVGLAISLVTGTLVLGVVVGPVEAIDAFGWELVVAGFLTFPVATGLYYFCGYAYDGRMEFASQFANVKPLFSILLALLLLGESLTGGSMVAFLFIVGGVAALWAATARGEFSWGALMLGLLLAASWAGGEAFIKLGVGSVSTLPATLVALSSGAALGLMVIVPVLARRQGVFRDAPAWTWAFAVHGLISFVLAYSALFESIRRIGLAQTILINAFWPALAIGLAWIIARLQGRLRPISFTMLSAVVLLLAGSLIQVLVL